MPDEIAQKLGEQIAYILRLKFEDGVYHSQWGPMSHKGLGRFVAEIAKEYDEGTDSM